MKPSSRLLERNAFNAPRLADRYVPWARAVITVGQHLYRDEWEGAELARSAYTLADRADEIEAEVNTRYPAPRVSSYSPTIGKARRGSSVTAPDVVASIQAVSAARAAERSAFAAEVSKKWPSLSALQSRNDARKLRLLDAQDRLYGAIINREVPAFWCVNGMVAPIPEPELIKDWNCTGSGDLRRLGYIWRDRASRYVYVDRKSLGAAFPLNPMRETTVGSIPLDQLSPYLQLMIQVSLQEGLTSESRTPPEKLGARLIAEAPQFGLEPGSGNDGSHITTTWAKQLAKALRWPDARKGRAEPGNTRKG